MATLQYMDEQLSQWEAAGDRRAIFLACYRTMTANMLAHLEKQFFQDSPWVQSLLDHFADYYFDALLRYENGEETAAVWKQVHDLSKEENISALQRLLMGVNAHINYDLVLSLYDVLHQDWSAWSESERRQKQQDHERVNTVIANTIDVVQDNILEPAQPFMAVVDRAFGRLDEYLLSKLIANWREDVWQHASALLEIQDETRRKTYISELERTVLKRTRMIGMV